MDLWVLAEAVRKADLEHLVHAVRRVSALASMQSRSAWLQGICMGVWARLDVEFAEGNLRGVIPGVRECVGQSNHCWMPTAVVAMTCV